MPIARRWSRAAPLVPMTRRMSKQSAAGWAGAFLFGWIVLSFTLGASALGGLCAVLGAGLLVYAAVQKDPASPAPARVSDATSATRPVTADGLNLVSAGANRDASNAGDWQPPSTPAQDPTAGLTATGAHRSEPVELNDGTDSDKIEPLADSTQRAFWSVRSASRSSVIVLGLLLAAVGFGGAWWVWQDSQPSAALQRLRDTAADVTSEIGLLESIDQCQQYRDDPNSYFASFSSVRSSDLTREEFDGFFTPRCAMSPPFEVRYFTLVLDTFDADGRADICRGLREDMLRPYFDRIRTNTVDREYSFRDGNGDTMGEGWSRTFTPLRDLKYSELELELLARC